MLTERAGIDAVETASGNAFAHELVVIGGSGAQSNTNTWTKPPGTTTEVADVAVGTLSSFLADELGPVTPGATGSLSATDSRSGELTGTLLALTPGTATTTTAYDADDEASLSTDPDGNATLTCYDGDGQVAETVPPVGVAANSLTMASCPTSYPSDDGDRLAADATTDEYDALGDETVTTTPTPAGLTEDDETTTNAYDPAGRLTSTTAPSTTATDSEPQVTAYTYDGAGETLTTTTASGTAAAAETLSCYDPNGDRTAVVAPDGDDPTLQTCETSAPYETTSGYETGYSYDSVGEVVATVSPTGTCSSTGDTDAYTYDADGNLASSEDANCVTTTNTYDAQNDLTGMSYSGSATHAVSEDYDAAGNRTSMTDASGTTTSGYDPFGELTSLDNGAGKTVDSTYDALGNVTSVTYPLGSATWAGSDTVHDVYDAASELSSVTDFTGRTISVTDTADGLAASLRLGDTPDAIVTTYDDTDSPSEIDLAQGSSSLLEVQYADAQSGAILSETDTPTSSYAPVYTYDAESRVTSLTPGTMGTADYTYDPSDNLETLPNGASATYNDASELTSSLHASTTTDDTYDADGERTQEKQGATTTMSASYNGAQELTASSSAAADMTSATYNGDGLRSSETTGSVTQNFVWDLTPSVPQVLMDSTNAYVYAGSTTPVEQVSLSSGTVRYLVSDGLGSVRGVANAFGALSASTSYDTWGNPQTSGGLTSSTPFGFAGGYTDPTGLLYLVHRYYDPATGSFLTVDPDVAETGEPYAYTGDDPVNGVDPLGLWGWNPVSDVTQAWNDTGGKAVSAVKVAAVDTGQWVYANASNLSTITSGLAALAYASCAVTAGVGCGVGVALSATSTSLAALNTYRACSSDQGCASAATGLGLSLIATGAGISLQRALASSLSLENAYTKDIYLARQAGVTGAALNGLNALLGAAETAYNKFKSLEKRQHHHVPAH